MHAETFEDRYDALTRLNNTDGPNHNVFEPKFQAREEMKSLVTAVTNTHVESPSIVAQVQISRCYLFIGNTMIETEEVANGFSYLYRAHFVLAESIKGNLLSVDDLKNETNLNTILTMTAPLVDDSTGYTYVKEYVSCLNTLGLHMCSTEAEQKINDAKKLLHLAEDCYHKWDAFFKKSGGVDISDVPMSDDGKVLPDIPNRAEMLLRLRMDSLYTSTLFFLAQAYTQSDARVASKYAHLTMVHQLQTRSEFSKKSWAENALHLSGFYGGQHQFGKALHCLEAGKYMMPAEPDDEETGGRVAWAFGRYHLSRLRYYAPGPNMADTFVDDSHSWFVPFPLPIPLVEKQPHIRTFEEARDEFKKANASFQLALKYFPFDGQCTDHMIILKDISDLYRALIAFEPDVERQVAMHMRRLTLLENIPSELNPQSYLTNIRQLQFDIADIANDIFEVRLLQKNAKDSSLGKPLSDRQMNLVNERAQKKYREFLESFKGDSQPEEVRMAVFRAKMRICALLTKKFHKTPKEEYDAITEAIDAYGDVLKFTEINPMDAEVHSEIELARQMHALLPGKKRSIAQAFQHSN